MKIKIERVNSELMRQITKIIAEDVKDPRRGNAIISVTKVYTTPDLKYAKVYLSILADSPERRDEALYAVNRSKLFIKNMLKERVNMDDSVDYSIKIDGIINEIHKMQAGAKENR